MSNLASLFDRYKALVIFDTETSGLNPGDDQIIELAALAEQFGGTFATEDQLTTALSFMLGTLRATREKEARHE